MGTDLELSIFDALVVDKKPGFPRKCCLIKIHFFTDRLDYLSFFTPVTKFAPRNYDVYISRTLPGYTTANCLAECFFTPTNDCHFAVTVSKICYIGTFKLWPLETPSTSPMTYTVYIYGGYEYFNF